MNNLQVPITQKLSVEVVTEIPVAYGTPALVAFGFKANKGFLSVDLFNDQGEKIGNKSYVVSGAVYDSMRNKLSVQEDVGKSRSEIIATDTVLFIMALDAQPEQFAEDVDEVPYRTLISELNAALR